MWQVSSQENVTDATGIFDRIRDLVGRCQATKITAGVALHNTSVESLEGGSDELLMLEAPSTRRPLRLLKQVSSGAGE